MCIILLYRSLTNLKFWYSRRLENSDNLFDILMHFNNFTLKICILLERDCKTSRENH